MPEPSPAASVRLICPNLRCRSILSVPVAARGKVVRCRQCGIRIHVPAPAGSSPPKPADQPAAAENQAA